MMAGEGISFLPKSPAACRPGQWRLLIVFAAISARLGTCMGLAEWRTLLEVRPDGGPDGAVDEMSSLRGRSNSCLADARRRYRFPGTRRLFLLCTWDTQVTESRYRKQPRNLAVFKTSLSLSWGQKDVFKKKQVIQVSFSNPTKDVFVWISRWLSRTPTKYN